MKQNYVSGGISGAITDVTSTQAMKHAKMYYEEIRHMSTDVAKIAKNTRFTQEQILQVKHFLFLDKHVLGDGEEPKYFDPCFEIAESWRRLMGKKKDIQKHDITLINHELTEMELICKGYSQADAHNITNKKYNYTEESDNYYHELRLKISPKEINGGGIRRLLSHRTH